MTNFKRFTIKSVMIIPQGMIHAVYYLPREDVLHRTPIVFGAVVSSSEYVSDDFELWDEDQGGCFSDCAITENFLGYEYNGIEKNWSEVVEYRKAEYRKRWKP